MEQNIVRKGEIACSKQFLLFSQCFPQLYIFSPSECGIVYEQVKREAYTCNPGYRTILHNDIVVRLTKRKFLDKKW